MNIQVAIIATIFGAVKAMYFSNLLFPRSAEELICNGIMLAIYAMSFLGGDR